MSCTIAITGKGGTGKTTVAGLLITRLIARGCSPVLAVDADPNACLDAALGVRVEKTVGGVREEARQIVSGTVFGRPSPAGAGVSKQELLELKIAESLVEAEDFDLISMGRPEGPGCYCYANNVLGRTIARIAESYPYVVIDNEAGLENLSRRIVRRVDLLVMVSDPSKRGLDTVERLYDLAGEMEIHYDRLAIVVNRLRRDELPGGAAALREKTGAHFLVALPHSETLAELSERGEALAGITQGDPAAERLGRFLAEAGIGMEAPKAAL